MKNKKLFFAGVLVVLTLVLSAYYVTGTYAKYASTNTGSGSARVAKWDVELNGKNIAKESFTFDLYDTLLDTDGSEESDVKAASGSTDKVIAPGTQGSFAIKIQNKSEVTAEYTVTFNVTNGSSIPLEFSTDGGTTWSSKLSDIAATKLDANQSDASTVSVMWRWAYSASTTQDAADTTLGTADTLGTLSVTANVTATQAD